MANLYVFTILTSTPMQPISTC